MEEHPILYTGEMVNAILEDRKTMTRRVLRKQPRDIAPMNVPNMWMIHKESGAGQIIGCNYGRPGDRLWVRETWRCEELDSGLDGVRYAADNSFRPIENTMEASRLWIAASRGNAWRPSIYMPRWASRITLEIVRIKVQRLQEITGDECTLEGIEVAWSDPNNNKQEIAAFQNLWNKINSARGYGWDVNPWVWVIEFKKL